MTPEPRTRARRAGDDPGLRREFGLGLRYIVVLVLPASVLFAVLAQPMLGVIVRHQFPRTTRSSPPTRCRRSRSASCRSRCTSTSCARSTRCRTRARRSCSTRSRTLSTWCSRSSLFPALGVQGLALAWSGAYLVAAVVALVVLRRRIGGVPERPRSCARRPRRSSAARARQSSRSAVAGAIGHSSPAERLAGDGGRGRRWNAGLRRRLWSLCAPTSSPRSSDWCGGARTDPCPACNHVRPRRDRTSRFRPRRRHHRGGRMPVRIVTDSACDLPEAICEELGIEVVPLTHPLRRSRVRRPQGAERRRVLARARRVVGAARDRPRRRSVRSRRRSGA